MISSFSSSFQERQHSPIVFPAEEDLQMFLWGFETSFERTHVCLKLSS